ncbi:MAG: 23S rRNA (uracil(1939)-C(5))-methyltransferase RlmD, partial [Bacillota bacterium]|nr:23S rRNA (uracil(1939)-C(5))-methyltransferase RlmD [Bacillota bacterium]
MTELTIIDMSDDGRGIGKDGGLIYFVQDALPGDVVRVEVLKQRKTFVEARAAELLRPSPQRQELPCPQAGSCGGCPLMGLTYQAQLSVKQKWVRDRLTRIGGVQDPPVRDILGMEEPWRYRNKAVFTAGRAFGPEKKEKGCRVGFCRAGSREVTDCPSCLIQTEGAERLAEAFRQYIKENKVPVYDEKEGTGLLKQLIVRTAFGTGQLMAIVVAAEKRIPEPQRLTSAMTDSIEALNQEIEAELGAGAGEEYGYSLASVILHVDKEKRGGAPGASCITLAGSPTIRDYACGMEWEISPLSFYQVNPPQMERLYQVAGELAGLTGTETVLDLYCGVGAIGLTLAGQAAQVVGVESVKSAVLDANRNAVLNGIVNARFICGKAEELLPLLLAESGQEASQNGKASSDALLASIRSAGVTAPHLTESGQEASQNGKASSDALLASIRSAGVTVPLRPDLVILDPPRAGCHPALLSALTAALPPRILYVSCDPATLARDVKSLTAAGYRLTAVQPLDMFPHTANTECAVLMT